MRNQRDPNPIVQGHSKGVTGHINAGTEDSVRSLLVQLIGGCGLGFPGCKRGWDLRIPNSVPHRGSGAGWLARLTTTTTNDGWMNMGDADQTYKHLK